MKIDKVTKVFDLHYIVKKDNGKLNGIHITLKPQAQLPQFEECFSYFATHFLYPASNAFPIYKKRFGHIVAVYYLVFLKTQCTYYLLCNLGSKYTRSSR